MIINPGQTAFRYIGQQYLFLGDQPSLSFEMEANSLSEDMAFGFCERDAYPTTIDSFILKSGLVFDKLNRMVGTYQSGLNTFTYEYGRDNFDSFPTSNFKINDRLVYVNEGFPEIGEYIFTDCFFVSNSGSSSADFDLNISGFHPPIAFGRLLTEDYKNFTGEMYHPSLVNYSYRLMGVNSNYQFLSSTGIPSGGYLFTGSGNFVLSGSAGPSQIIPVTLDFDFGQYIYNFEVGSTGVDAGTGVGGGGNATYLTLEGTTNEVLGGQSITFDSYYYSTSPQLVTIEMTMTSGSSRVLLSGNSTGGGVFQGYINGSGYLYSDRVTGYADFSQPWNSGYNSQYQNLPPGIDVEALGERSVFSYYTGIYTYSWVGQPMTKTIFPPGGGLPTIYAGTGYGSANFQFSQTDQGVLFVNYILTGTIPQEGNPPFPPSFDGTEANYPGDKYITGQGYMTLQTGNIPFLGYGFGIVSPSVKKQAVSATGVITYTGDPSIGYNWSSLGSPGSFPLPNPGINSSYSIFSGESAYGTANFEGMTILATGGLGAPNYFYPRGQSYIVIDGLVEGLTDYYDYSFPFTGTSPHPTGGTVTRSITGNAYGYAFIQQGAYLGPVFSGGQDSTLYPYSGYSKSGAFSNVSYGRGIITGSWRSTGVSNTGIGLWFPPVNLEATFVKNWTENVGGTPVDFTATKTAPVSIVTPGKYIEDSSITTRILPTMYSNQDIDGYDGIYLTFPTSPSRVSQSGVFDGFGWTTGAGGFPFDLYSGDGTNFISFREYGYTGNNKYIQSGIPFGATFKDFVLRVDYSPDVPLGNTDQATLRVYTSNITGEVIISGFGNGV